LKQNGHLSQKEASAMTTNLSPFANMMLNATNIAFTCKLITLSDVVRGKLKEVPDPQREAFASAAKPVGGSFPPSTDSPANGHRQFLRPAVVVPPLDPSKNYHLGEDQGAPKRRKLNAEYDTSATDLRLKDQKEEADAALLKLQDLMHEVFETEDRLEPDTSSAALAQESNAMFRVPNVLEVRGPILGPESHSRLQKSLQKVTAFGRLHDIPSEYITRLQKLCEQPVISAQGLDLRLDDPSNDADTQTWLFKLEDMYNTLLAIGTLLQTMSGRRSEKDLCPEDLIQAVPNVLTAVFDHCIIPAAECRPVDKESKLFELVTREKRIIGSLNHQARKLLGSLANFFSRIDVSEGVVTSTMFLATKLIFVENAHNDKDSAIGYQKFESVRRAAMDVLAKIFSRYPDQRPYILDEILVSLEKLPSTRQNARQFKLIDGKNIQLLTALVMQLVQTTAMDTPQSNKSRAKRRIPVPRGDNDDDDELVDTKYEEESESDDNSDDGFTSKASLERLASRANKLYDNAVRSAQYIIKFIVQRAMTSTKTGDQPYRNILDLFTEDLLGVLGSTDWPAAELLLRILASHMVGIAELDKSSAAAKNMALELLGWMGSGISDLTATAQHLMLSMEEGGNSITEYLRQAYDEHSRHALHPQDLVAVDGPYRITLEYLQNRDLDNWQLTSARGYYLVQWAKTVASAYYESADRDTVSQDRRVHELLSLLPKLLSDPKWLETNRYVSDINFLKRNETVLTTRHAVIITTFQPLMESSRIS
jgi:cohesin loading factor subunit SCC2